MTEQKNKTIRLAQCTNWNSIPVEQCSQCENRATNVLIMHTGIFNRMRQPVCDKHFMEWLNNKLEFKIPTKEQKPKKDEVLP